MRVSASWSQDVVLRAMCDDIGRRRESAAPDFILATGDLAFSGQADEYRLATDFFDAVSVASGVPKSRIFCIAGNHDIDRERQKMCFQGFRSFIQSQNQIDSLLSPGEDLATLLKRQESYREFQRNYFMGQDRVWTDDGLAYVSCLSLGDVRVAILGMDSAWLAEGDLGDHGKLLIGERQAINAINLAVKSDPHVTIGMAHHPFHLLQDFDRRCVQSRVENSCLFFHCGHLHEPEARTAGFDASGCLTLSAGASFETRQSQNSYSLVTLDLLGGQRAVTTVQYNPTTGAFSSESTKEYPVEIIPSATCGLTELAAAMKASLPQSSPWAHYLSAVLLDKKSELPVSPDNSCAFGSFSVLIAQPDDEFRRRTIRFIAFKNALRIFYNRMQLADLFRGYGQAVSEYATTLTQKSDGHPELKKRLADHETDAQAIAAADQQPSFSYTGALLTELAAAGEWLSLREQAERHVGSSDAVIKLQARRMLALSLAHSAETSDKQAATAMYKSMLQETSFEFTDAGNFATLLIADGNFDEAKTAILNGIDRFPAKTDYFFQIGLKIVEALGDREFRAQLMAAAEARGQRD
jgi:3',5'-cyclic AMP phosphodiesterase CpdA